MSAARCYIDGCGKPATLILHTYPDRTVLCDDHRGLLDVDDPMDATAEVCPGEGCDVCEVIDAGDPFAWPGEVVPR